MQQLDRRFFLKSAALIGCSAAAHPLMNSMTFAALPGDNRLVVIILICAIGSVPMWIALRTTRWSLKRRLDASERQLADMRALANRPVEPAPVATPAPATTPGTASPTLPLDIP